MSKNILVIEDGENWQDTIGRILNKNGYETQFAPSYREALEKILKTGSWFAGFDIRLCTVDLSLGIRDDNPNYDGLGILAITRLRGIPTVVISGYITDAIQYQLKNDFGVKGVFEKDKFSSKIQEFLKVIKSEFDNIDQNKNQVIQNLDIGDIKFTSKKKSLMDDAIECYRKSQDHINKLQYERIKVRGEKISADEDVWKKQIEHLDNMFESFHLAVMNAKNIRELETLKMSLPEECMKWMAG